MRLFLTKHSGLVKVFIIGQKVCEYSNSYFRNWLVDLVSSINNLLFEQVLNFKNNYFMWIISIFDQIYFYNSKAVHTFKISWHICWKILICRWLILPGYQIHWICATQRPRIYLNKRFLLRPNTTTAWKLIPQRSNISKN